MFSYFLQILKTIMQVKMSTIIIKLQKIKEREIKHNNNINLEVKDL